MPGYTRMRGGSEAGRTMHLAGIQDANREEWVCACTTVEGPMQACFVACADSLAGRSCACTSGVEVPRVNKGWLRRCPACGTRRPT